MTDHTVAPDAGVRRRPSTADLLAATAGRVRRLDVRNTWQLAAGAIMAPLGVVVILLSWYGAAHTPYVQQQIPYLVSGSFVGLGLMVVGGLLFWAHWLYRIYDQADLHHAEQLAQQQQLFEQLMELVATRPPQRPGRTGPAAPASGSGAADGLVVTSAGTNVHRSDCPIVSRHSSGLRQLSAEEARDRPPCRICQPWPESGSDDS